MPWGDVSILSLVVKTEGFGSGLAGDLGVVGEESGGGEGAGSGVTDGVGPGVGGSSDGEDGEGWDGEFHGVDIVGDTLAEVIGTWTWVIEIEIEIGGNISVEGRVEHSRSRSSCRRRPTRSLSCGCYLDDSRP